MKKLNKAQLKEKEKLVGDMETTFQDLQEVTEAFNEAKKINKGLPEALKEVEKSLTAYNASLEAATAFAETIIQEIQDYMDNKSEAWQESDKAGEYQDWVASWEELSFETIGLSELSEVDGSLDVDNNLEEQWEQLDNVPTEVGG